MPIAKSIRASNPIQRIVAIDWATDIWEVNMGLDIRALSPLLFSTMVMSFSQSVADEFQTILNSVPRINQSSVAGIIKNYEKECMGFQDGKNKQSLKIHVKDIVSTKLLQGNTELTLVIADFGCPGHGNPWTGSDGSPTYLIIGDRTFQGPNSRPSFHNLGNWTLISFWHHGSHCKTVTADDYPGAGLQELAPVFQ